MVTVGLDLHKRYITACALDDAGTVLAESRRLDASLETLGRWLGALPQPLIIARSHPLLALARTPAHRPRPSRRRQAWLAAVALPVMVRRHVELLLANHALLTTQIQALARHIKDTVKRDATATRLQTIPGIGPFGALLLQAEIGPISRFASAQELAAYAGLVPSTRSSGGKTHDGGDRAGESLAQVAPDRGAPDAEAGAGARRGSL